jgi:hypothetical protein
MESFKPLKNVWLMLCLSFLLSLSFELLLTKLNQQFAVLLKEYGLSLRLSLLEYSSSSDKLSLKRLAWSVSSDDNS